MKTLTRVVAIAVAAGVFQGTGIALPSAFAGVPARTDAAQKPIEKIADFQAEQPLKASVRLVQYSEDPTIPGDGTPQRSQGSSSR